MRTLATLVALALSASAAQALTPLPSPYVARGQEPGWIAEVRPGGPLELTLDYGERRLTTAPARVKRRRGVTIYSAPSPAGPVRLTAARRQCFDAMSGAPYRDTVTLTVAGRRYEGCGGPVRADASALFGPEWVLDDVDNRGVPDNVRATVAFSPDGRVTGSTGCNRLNGVAVLGQGSISFGHIATTRRGCLPALADLERRYLVALGQSTGWRLDPEGVLFLNDAEGLVRLRFTR